MWQIVAEAEQHNIERSVREWDEVRWSVNGTALKAGRTDAPNRWMTLAALIVMVIAAAFGLTLVIPLLQFLEGLVGLALLWLGYVILTS